MLSMYYQKLSCTLNKHNWILFFVFNNKAEMRYEQICLHCKQINQNTFKKVGNKKQIFVKRNHKII